MNNQIGDTIVGAIIESLGYLGALFHWLLFFGRKPFYKVLQSTFLNSLAGIVIITVLIILFKNEVLELILYFVNKRLNHK